MGRGQKPVSVQIPVTFSDSDRHQSGGGRGLGRGSQRSPGVTTTTSATLNDLVPNVASEEDFPCLS